MNGHNVFYTGSAGCRKSVVLRTFKKRLEKMNKRVFVIAPTNLAALNVGGITTWGYTCWAPKTNMKSVNTLLEEMEDKMNGEGEGFTCKFTETDVLVIDEVSMMESNFFERLNYVMKRARNSTAAFGGVQMVVTGGVC